jgi:hypothetical protein
LYSKQFGKASRIRFINLSMAWSMSRGDIGTIELNNGTDGGRPSALDLSLL